MDSNARVWNLQPPAKFTLVRKAKMEGMVEGVIWGKVSVLGTWHVEHIVRRAPGKMGC